MRILIFALVKIWTRIGQKTRPVLHLVGRKLQGLLQLAEDSRRGWIADVEFMDKCACGSIGFSLHEFLTDSLLCPLGLGCGDAIRGLFFHLALTSA